jgi:hypothetical protein
VIRSIVAAQMIGVASAKAERVACATLAFRGTYDREPVDQPRSAHYEIVIVQLRSSPPNIDPREDKVLCSSAGNQGVVSHVS